MIWLFECHGFHIQISSAWQVSIVPLVTVDIQELVPRDSGEDAEQAAVFIKPRRPASSQQLVSLVLEVTRERAAHATVRCESPGFATIHGLVYVSFPQAALNLYTRLQIVTRQGMPPSPLHWDLTARCGRLPQKPVPSPLNFSTGHNRAGGRSVEARISGGGWFRVDA